MKRVRLKADIKVGSFTWGLEQVDDSEPGLAYPKGREGVLATLSGPKHARVVFGNTIVRVFQTSIEPTGEDVKFETL